MLSHYSVERLNILRIGENDFLWYLDTPFEFNALMGAFIVTMSVVTKDG